MKLAGYPAAGANDGGAEDVKSDGCRLILLDACFRARDVSFLARRSSQVSRAIGTSRGVAALS